MMDGQCHKHQSVPFDSGTKNKGLLLQTLTNRQNECKEHAFSFPTLSGSKKNNEPASERNVKPNETTNTQYELILVKILLNLLLHFLEQ